jgi:hypothetical protein
MSRRPVLAVALAAAIAVAPAHAEPDAGAQGFMNLYVSLCMKNFTDMAGFRARAMKAGVPRLPPESAKFFLGQYKGDAWPVPYKGRTGNFVLAMATDKNLCKVFARRADARQIEREFLATVKAAPAPILVRVHRPVVQDDGANGKTRTVGVTWTRPGQRRSIQFMLSTSASDKASVQALGTVATIVD